MTKKPTIQPQDKYVLRLPDGMRERIKKAAERSGRSMNAEIILALEHYFPPEPSLEEVIDRVHVAIEQAKSSGSLPYRQVLIEALDTLSDRLSSGLEFDQHASRLPNKGMEDWDKTMARMDRWRRAREHGVETEDLKRELERGLLRRHGADTIQAAIQKIEEGKPEVALKWFRLGDVKFAEPEKAHAAMLEWLKDYYAENWGDPSDEPWSLPDEEE
ncbi:Arc family DNA-binding protein [Sinorhizobium meliloti]|nr:Arc family DNA-binding protein [Sinorhizobium meliloti]MDW9847565.1 Arc family DNA-binding protein [Sinorhizobium meliloti]MDX0144052.1 Arc family DNA-binding protein [Sinorhizobium meliloti]MDX0150477.1 Arc family DNA-binding protein [Sinorhizobium meliloti]MDX0169743.1 Arc family DNA-binding protein [Sinorhizobium meliloti]